MTSASECEDFCHLCRFLGQLALTGADLWVPGKIDIPELQSRIHLTSTALGQTAVWPVGLVWRLVFNLDDSRRLFFFSLFLPRAVSKSRQERDRMGCQGFLGIWLVKSGDEVWQASWASYLCYHVRLPPCLAHLSSDIGETQCAAASTAETEV